MDNNDQKPVKAHYLKLVAESEVRGHPWTSIAELDIFCDILTR